MGGSAPPGREGDRGDGAGWVELRSAAPFGVAERRRRLPAEGPTLVLPRIVPIPVPSFIEASTAREPSVRTDPRRGPGPEYLGVREYRAGDPIRQIHWRLTARHGDLVVRDLEEERIPRLAIWVDTSLDDVALDRCCTVAASILEAATVTGAGVRLATATTGGPIAATRVRAIDLHRWLARLSPGGVGATDGLAWLDGRALRGIGTLVAIVMDPTAAGLDRAIAGLVRTVPRLVVCVPVDGEHDLGPEDAGVRELLAAGADVVPWIGERGLGGPLVRPVEASA